jgi:cold-inducible RNA-binding protein
MARSKSQGRKAKKRIDSNEEDTTLLNKKKDSPTKMSDVHAKKTKATHKPSKKRRIRR